MLKSEFYVACYRARITQNLHRKKKKSKPKSEASTKAEELERMKDLLSQTDDKEITTTGSGRNSPALASSSSRKTEAERRFEEVQKRRVSFAFLFRMAVFT